MRHAHFTFWILSLAALALLTATLEAQPLQAKPTPPTSATTDFNISPLETRVLGQRTWLRGGPAALPVLWSVTITLKAAGPPRSHVRCPSTRVSSGEMLKSVVATAVGAACRTCRICASDELPS